MSKLTEQQWKDIQARKAKAASAIASIVKSCRKCGAKSSQRKLDLDGESVCSMCRKEEQVEAQVYEGKGYGDFA